MEKFSVTVSTGKYQDLIVRGIPIKSLDLDTRIPYGKKVLNGCGVVFLPYPSEKGRFPRPGRFRLTRRKKSSPTGHFKAGTKKANDGFPPLVERQPPRSCDAIYDPKDGSFTIPKLPEGMLAGSVLKKGRLVWTMSKRQILSQQVRSLVRDTDDRALLDVVVGEFDKIVRRKFGVTFGSRRGRIRVFD